MRSLDPMRNFPELDALSETEAKRLIVETQKRITREPVVLIGLIVALMIPAFTVLLTTEFTGLIAAAIAGALIGLVAWAYMIAVIKPRMHAAFRDMGYQARS
ncbi:MULTISPECIES: hypothetical protein [unclassified Beijerinckia]|uniref:hypothetical protein n=1 Tax=unclassified Beijerinckia TaxID=2638183 RepID=UPI000894D7E3|nr:MULTISPECIES: hypothetical protein [unclassified Beijerinckia]MDH7799344.1 L-lactate permease [Beijerinckia sp. GAS462]SED46998.1 hypothetical protein SAMN05443249_5462 [Beijerinckia sp. 28-YEA-48]